MRMLRRVNLLAPDGYVNRPSRSRTCSPSRATGSEDGVDRDSGAVYGYIPFMILPSSPRSTASTAATLTAARDLGASRFSTFLHVTLPLSKAGILGGAVLIALPMFGDYYTPNIVSGAPETSMIGNQIDLPTSAGSRRSAPRSRSCSRCSSPSSWPLHRGRSTRPRARHGAHDHGRGRAGAAPLSAWSRFRGWLTNPGAAPLPRSLHLGVHDLGARARPDRGAVLVQRLRSRTVWKPRPVVLGDPVDSVWHDPALRNALVQSRSSRMLIATPIGVLLAIGLARWTGWGRGPRTSCSFRS